MAIRPTIQVDMFEVQLGASLLLQFQLAEGETVRVLADGGHGPPISDIHKKLIDAVESFGDSQRTINLLVGTHYDADHLDGLVSIINDPSFAITEAWLPPVANDVEPHAADEPLRDSNFLAHQMYSPDGHRVLARYLNAKAQICQLLRANHLEAIPEARCIKSANLDELPKLRELFLGYRREAIHELEGHLEDEFTHANDDTFDPESVWGLFEHLGLPFWAPNLRRRWYEDRFADRELSELAAVELRHVQPNSIAAQNLAGIRKSAANDAINAISLAKIVDNLRSRDIPIACHVVTDGTPRRFAWRARSRRFEGAAHLPAQGPAINLLGPSEGLVKKHWNRLPIGVYAQLSCESLLRIKSITPSNQLSYVAHFTADGQGILVTGDAGCVDFKPGRRGPYYEALLSALSPLHIVQVAHHAGSNAHFYQVLKAARYPEAVPQSFLLLSHATRDRHRPSREFCHFVEDVRREPEIVSLLFTAQPLVDKIRGFEAIVHAPVGRPADQGDLSLRFEDGKWKVTKHAIALANATAWADLAPPIIGPSTASITSWRDTQRQRALDDPSQGL